LPRDKFRVTVACSPLGRNYFRQQVQNPDVEYFVLPGRIDQAAAAMRDMRFDVLLYWEIGTDSTNYFLPFYRLAPVQCTTFGWPITSGIPTVDYFLSSAELETPESGQFFSERLIRLPTLPTYYYQPELPPLMKSRADFGLPEKAPLYFCGQRLRKFHPDFDDLIAGILRTDSAGLFVCIGDKQPFMGELFRKRFATQYADVVDRVRIVPWLEFADYIQLTTLADVVLDTPHYGGGANTVYDALAAGRPIVTLPGRFQRGRYAMAANRRLELDECIAASPDEYVRRAAQLARESDLATQVSKRLAERRRSLFEDQRYIEVFEAFVETAISDLPH
jgi:protein O-GlcNAc transferase